MKDFVDELFSQVDVHSLCPTYLNEPTAPPPPPTRFALPKTDEQVEVAKEGAQPTATARSTKWALKLWSEWCVSRQAMQADSPPMPPTHFIFILFLKQ